MRTWIIVVALLVAPPPAFTQKVNVDSFRGEQDLLLGGERHGHRRITPASTRSVK